MKVPEVWVCDGKRIHLYRLDTEGKYVEVGRSQYFPFVPMEELTPFLLRRNQTDENGLIRSFREGLRDQVAKGWPTQS